MLVTYDGIVVGRREIGDSNLYLDILTEEQGIIEALAHNAKKINSSLLSSASLFAYSTFCFNCNEKTGRYTINSAKPKYSFHEIGADIAKLRAGGAVLHARGTAAGQPGAVLCDSAV